MLLTTPLGLCEPITGFSVIYMQSTPDNSNFEEKLKKVRVIGSSSYREFEANNRE